ncbi:succinylglutamate desuccinylase/aspartoacylase domain-containing protein [Psychroserpens sp.]|uniref:succinylglutamate desuccinylase/aspartoacylase domain-containing protein n=1 Tax=Psychroserpens sp. TaxID=2020870 RepID=UPI001B008CCE|nr:succinylglutamate desuccinylase/aspartoacylase family protein [Psychroserpens sp.]MBO6605337.1 succinylglutamate desuccinylase/aspartoacylase family protein [Psychroserpens sp.]MBO6629980.1 succinylglutamate desuccinylase/aspartoacylase family protein [Psychroserpens sp.]MBO6653854.1 succinylglutamate desuccinylase/aspartoacylase family protein [Psychroserpens sp.]MBO6682175.1 succinylglutamate desuccinylase/aspartoacylase family protein [Psychroserpens sp.]MBO6748711.1 succinylglutamate de
MTKVYSQAMDKTISVNRIITKIEGPKDAPTIVYFGGIHGNETAGVFALQNVFNSINPKDVNGNIYAISGNLQALKKNQRFLDKDLNRIWTKEQLFNLDSKTSFNREELEQKELFQIVESIIKRNSGPIYFIDFHTTSSKTIPFITINDAMINRKFSKLFPVPIVLGIEEYLNGPLLSYINELGYVSLGFESGQHDEQEAIENSMFFIYLSLVFAGVLTKAQIPKFETHYENLKTNAKALDQIFEVVYLHRIRKYEEFKMKNGFQSFQKVERGIPLAVSNNRDIRSRYTARIFMPLYQKKGEEGFFIIKPIKPFFLKLSAALRHLRFDGLLVMFPGITWENKNKAALRVDLRVVKYFAKSIFHLLGYRNRKEDATHLLIYNRERASKVKSYQKETWY